MNDIKQFPFYKNYYELLDNLPIEDKRLMLEVIVDFIFKGIEPIELKGMNLAIWNNIKMPLSNIKKQILNGSKGGRPKKEENPKDNPTKKPNKNQKDNPKRNQNNISNFIFLFNNLIINNINNKDSIYKLLEEYLDIRIKNKYVVNETVVKRLINKLNEYGLNDGEKIMVIENAINGKWKDFYPLKEHNPEWFNKELQNDPMTKEEQEDFDNILEDIMEGVDNL